MPAREIAAHRASMSFGRAVLLLFVFVAMCGTATATWGDTPSLRYGEEYNNTYMIDTNGIMQWQVGWAVNSTITSGISSAYLPAPAFFNMSGAEYLILGTGFADFYGFEWTGATWVEDSSIVDGIFITGNGGGAPTVFEMDGTWYLISGESDGIFSGFMWTGVAWVEDSSIVDGLSTSGTKNKPTVFEMDGTWYLISGELDGIFSGFEWEDMTWEESSSIVNGLGDIGFRSAPSTYRIEDTVYLITGTYNDGYRGFEWMGTTWEEDSSIVNGLDWETLYTTLSIFDMGDELYYIIGGSGVELKGWSYIPPPQTGWTAAALGGTATLNLTQYNMSAGIIGEFTISSGTLDWITITNLTSGGLYSLSYAGGDRIETLEASGTTATFSTNLPEGEYAISQMIVPNTTAIHGFVYEGTTETNVQIPSVIVTIYNTTWSDSTVTDSSGYYIYTNLTNDTYILTFTKDRYITVDYQYVTPANNETYQKDIWMQKDTGQFYSRHYVTFCVCNFWGARYASVNTVCYNDEIIDSTGTTGSDGSVVLSLFEDIEYRVTFINATQGISESLTLYPRDDYYYILVGETSAWTEHEHQMHEEIHTGVTKRLINDSHAWINVTYLDDLSGTTELVAYINETNLDDPANETMIATHVFTGDLNDTGYNFTVPMTGGQAYFVRLHNEHIEFGDNWYTYTVRRVGMLLDLGLPSGVYIYICIALVLFVGAMFGGTTSTIGSISICVLGWLFLAFGWLQPAMGIFGAISVSVASVYAVSTAIVHRHRKAGYA